VIQSCARLKTSQLKERDMSKICVAMLSLFFLSAQNLASGEARIVPPLHTSGYQIVDAHGHVVRLTSVNWYGFDQREYVVGGLDHASLRAIIGQIKALGVNSAFALGE
jgi:hypothetical protein